MKVERNLLIPTLCCCLLAALVAGCGGGDGATVSGDGDTTASSDGPVLLPVPDDPTVSFMIWFDVGSQDDPTGKEGLAALTGSMLSDGATTENSYEQILKRLYPIASGYSVRVDREMTTVTGRTHRDNLDTFFSLFTDAYLKPAFDQADFDRLRSNQKNFVEKTLRYAADEELGKAALFHAVFEGTSYAHPPAGTASGLDAITLDEVKGFYQNHFTADNAVFALGGGYPDDLVDRFTATREQLPAAAEEGEGEGEGEDEGGGEEPAAAAPAPRQIEGIEVTLIDKPNADASISLGFPIDVRRGEDEFYALWLANSWLGEHRNSSSHLYQVIRETRGMNYGDYSYIETFPEGGFRSMPPTNVARDNQLFEIWIRTLPNEQAHFALRAALRELQLLIDEGLTEEEFELTRSFLKKYVLHFAPTTMERLGYRVDDRFYGIEGEGHLARFRQRMDELTLEEVNAAIKKHLQMENIQIAIGTGAAEQLKQALVADTPSPMSYASEKPPEVLAEDEEIATFPIPVEEAKVTIIPVDEFLQ